MPVVELNGTLRTAPKVTATQAAVEVLGKVEAEAEAAIFSGEQLRRLQSTWRRWCREFDLDSPEKCTYAQWLWFLSLCGNFTDQTLEGGLQMHFHDSVVYENGGLLSSLLQRRKAGTCKRRNGMG
jgi:hypothetical protein